MSADPATGCDPTRCPFCGDSNRCARAADREATQCWCGPEKFPRNLLERVPESAVRRACICQRCLENHRAENSE